MAFLLLPIAFSSFLFVTSSQLTSAFGEQEQNQSNDVHQVRVYSLLLRPSVALSEIKSGLTDEQSPPPSTKVTQIIVHASMQTARIKVNDLICSPACGVKTHGRPVTPIYIPIQGNIMAGAGGSLGDFFEGRTVSTPSKGAYRVEVSPRISIKAEYDDNITLINKNPIGDYATTISPGLKISADSGSNGLDLDYEFGWVKYHKRTKNDYIQHRGTLGLWQKIGWHLTFRLEDTYLKSNDYLADINQFPVTQRVANTLSAYQRNDARAALDFQFGPKNHFEVGYLYNILDNDDPSLEDAREQGPFAALSYWFTQNDGLDLSYENLRYIYDQPDYYINWRDLNAHNMRVSYVRRFGIRTSGSLYYALSIRKSIDFPIQYEIHDAGAGFDHSFSPSTSVSLGLGYYKPTGDTSLPGTPALNPGVTSLIELRKSFQHGSVALGATSGWDDGLLEVVPRGFTKFGGAFGRFDYEPIENVSVFGGVTYRKNRYANEEIDILLTQATEDETYQGRCGVDWRLYRWFTLGLLYTYTNRISPDPEDEFVDNRIGLTLTAEKPFKW